MEGRLPAGAGNAAVGGGAVVGMLRRPGGWGGQVPSR